MGFIKDHWQAIASTAISTAVFAAVFVGVTLATGGFGAPVAVLAGMAAAGFVSGAVGYASQQALSNQPVDPATLLLQAGLSTAISVGTFGLGMLIAPEASSVATPLVVRMAETSAAGAAMGGGTQVVENAVAGRPLMDGVVLSTVLGAEGGAIMPVAIDHFAPVPEAPPTKDTTPVTDTSNWVSVDTLGETPPSKTTGVVGMLGGGGDDPATIKANFAAQTTGNAGFTTDQVSHVNGAVEQVTNLDYLKTLDQISSMPGQDVSVFVNGGTEKTTSLDFYDSVADQAAAKTPGFSVRDGLVQSSHSGMGPQYQINDPNFGPILVWTPDGKTSMFQLEGYSATNPIDMPAHGADYVEYELTGRNQSRFGSSPYTEKFPFRLGP